MSLGYCGSEWREEFHAELSDADRARHAAEAAALRCADYLERMPQGRGYCAELWAANSGSSWLPENCPDVWRRGKCSPVSCAFKQLEALDELERRALDHSIEWFETEGDRVRVIMMCARVRRSFDPAVSPRLARRIAIARAFVGTVMFRMTQYDVRRFGWTGYDFEREHPWAFPPFV